MMMEEVVGDGNGGGILRFKSRVQIWALIDKHASPFYSTNSVYGTHGMAQFIGPLIQNRGGIGMKN